MTYDERGIITETNLALLHVCGLGVELKHSGSLHQKLDDIDSYL